MMEWNGAGIQNCRSVICIVNYFAKIGDIIMSVWVEKSVGVLFCGLAYFSYFKIKFLCFIVR